MITARYKVVYTDYQHALMSICFSDGAQCEDSKRQVEIWTKQKAVPIPSDVLTHMNALIKEKLCIPLSDMVTYTPGKFRLTSI